MHDFTRLIGRALRSILIALRQGGQCPGRDTQSTTRPRPEELRQQAQRVQSTDTAEPGSDPAAWGAEEDAIHWHLIGRPTQDEH